MFLILYGIYFIGDFLKIKTILVKTLGLLMIFFSYYAIYFVSSSYFNNKNLNLFFIQASQYKPGLIKSPMIEIIISINIISLLILGIAILLYRNNKDSKLY